nr:hypothetical protein [bacterium]
MLWFGKKKIDKGAWAEVIFGKRPKNPENESEELLSRCTTLMLEQHHRIVMESAQIVHATRNADTRRGRIALCHQHYLEILKLKPFCNEEQLKMVREAEVVMKTIP